MYSDGIRLHGLPYAVLKIRHGETLVRFEGAVRYGEIPNVIVNVLYLSSLMGIVFVTIFAFWFTGCYGGTPLTSRS
jgi:hypothetical protein